MPPCRQSFPDHRLRTQYGACGGVHHGLCLGLPVMRRSMCGVTVTCAACAQLELSQLTMITLCTAVRDSNDDHINLIGLKSWPYSQLVDLTQVARLTNSESRGDGAAYMTASTRIIDIRGRQ